MNPLSLTIPEPLRDCFSGLPGPLICAAPTLSAGFLDFPINFDTNFNAVLFFIEFKGLATVGESFSGLGSEGRMASELP